METITILTSVAKMVGISPALLLAVCMTESGLKNHVHVENDGGSPSYGICQVKLDTAHFMGKKFNRPKMKKFSKQDMKELEKNVRVAAFYIKYQIERYDGDLCKAIAAYNAGSFKESSKYPGKPKNLKYVKKVQKNLKEFNEEMSYNLDCNSKVAAN